MPRSLQLIIGITLPIITAGIFAGVVLLAYVHASTNQIPDMQKTLTTIEGHTNQLSVMQTTLAGIEERTKDIGDMKSGVDKLLGKFGIAEVTSTGGTLAANNVQVEIPPNSVTEPTWFSLEKISSSSLPAALPNKNYKYSDGFVWSTQGVKLGSAASVAWGLALGSDCEQTKILHWNTTDYMWQEVPTEYCSTSHALVGFNAKAGGYYVLTKKAE